MNKSSPPLGTLIIRLGSDISDPVYWYSITGERKNKQCGRINNYSELKSLSSFFNYNVTVLVSSSFVIFRRIKLISKKILNKESSIAFSIEPTIVSNIDDFHIVVLKSDDFFCYITAIEHKLMNLWLGWLKDVGIYTNVMIPDVLTLPFDGDKYFSIKLNNEWLIRDSGESGFVLRDDIFDSLCLSSYFSGDENIFISINSREENAHSADYCDVLRIMADNIDNNSANLLSGRYHRHDKQMIKTFSFFRTVNLFFLLSIVIFFNSWVDKNNILRDIHMLNESLQDIHVQYPLLQQSMDNESINDKVDYRGYSVIKPDFIRLLHATHLLVGDLNIVINSISFDNEQSEISFNINKSDENGMGLNVISEEKQYLNVDETINDDGTRNIIFKYLL
ncbi:general secretion pathway protein GspL [Yersinia canariae]|uniref:General secretion pathway protein GspL n=1 Tax=Yersinia canariae TaxID=2607663 RepID=A0A857F2K6_9GAMM|nr:type II secretion system protein GspL [Yersinia canariae]QHB33750.1 general secretion pathway protein GspL [Yersinia canariae]